MIEIFQNYYDTNFWRDKESVSGPGSNLKATEAIRKQLPALFFTLGITNILDAACGDFHWMKEIMRFSHLNYVGYDVVPKLVDENNRRWGDDTIEFRVCDITRDTVRRADLILARDVLVHFSHNDTRLALQNFRRSGSKYLLATTFPGAPDTEIETGSWRPIDLSRLRYGLGPPTFLLPEHTETTNKSLGLWRIN